MAWLGLSQILEAKRMNEADLVIAGSPKIRAGSLRSGFLIGVLNPKARGAKTLINDHMQAAQVYADLQNGLTAAEGRIIEKGTVYNRDGLARVMQNAASTAATTGRADYASSEVSRSVLKAFVALEGKDAMAELATGNMDPLAEYLDTPASRRLAARELLTSAKQVDVGLGVDEIETGLEAVDPNYSRSRGISI